LLLCLKWVGRGRAHIQTAGRGRGSPGQRGPGLPTVAGFSAGQGKFGGRKPRLCPRHLGLNHHGTKFGRRGGQIGPIPGTGPGRGFRGRLAFPPLVGLAGAAGFPKNVGGHRWGGSEGPNKKKRGGGGGGGGAEAGSHPRAPRAPGSPLAIPPTLRLLHVGGAGKDSKKNRLGGAGQTTRGRRRFGVTGGQGVPAGDGGPRTWAAVKNNGPGPLQRGDPKAAGLFP